MGCNCKSGKAQVINNLKSRDHLELAVDLYDRYKDTDLETFNDLDWLEFFGVYNAIYPNSSQQPSKEDCYRKVMEAKDLYYINYKRQK